MFLWKTYGRPDPTWNDLWKISKNMQFKCKLYIRVRNKFALILIVKFHL